MSKVLNLKQLEKHIESLSDEWFVSGDNYLSAEYEFESFKNSLGFIVKMAEVAEKMDHHPEVNWNFRKVEVRINSHEVGGITRRDFEFAKKVMKCLKK